MKLYGLIGYPLGHSFSPAYFAEKFRKEGIENCEYKAFPLTHIMEVESLLEAQVQGFNVTIPYKQDIMVFLHEIDPVAEEIGAVNCVKNVDGKLIGYNTDEYGFQTSLLGLIGENFSGKALVLGTGGAAKAVFYVLKNMNIPFEVVSRRHGFLNYETLTETTIKDHRLIINTTPLGMYPHDDECPHIPYDGISENHYLYDLIYNPAETRFLQEGKKRGAGVKNGEDMLVLQAEKSWQIWNRQ